MNLDIKNLSIEFYDAVNHEKAVDNISFCIPQGKIIGVVGESGSGKSLTAMAIAGLLPRKKMYVKGEIDYRGENLLTMKRRELRTIQGKEIAMIFQEPMTALNPTMRIGYQVEEALRIHTDMSKEEMKAEAVKWIGLVGIDEPERIYRAYPHELSGGMRQRIMIAAAMIGKPSLLIADEPTTALDVSTQSEIIDLLIDLNKKNDMSVLFISHDLSLVKCIAEYCIVMKDGQIVEKGNTVDIFNNPTTEYTKKLIAAIPKVDLSK